MAVSRQVRRAEERKRQKEEARLAKQLNLSTYTYVADDHNLTLSALAPQVIDFMKVVGLPDALRDHVNIEKRDSLYPPEKLSSLLVLQNILGYDRIESSRVLDHDFVIKAKLGLDRYPDPETFRNELEKYTLQNIEELFLVNRIFLEALCRLVEPQYVDLHYDTKVITVYGDQEGAEIGYNPHKPGRKSYHMKLCTIETFGVIIAIELLSGDAVSNTDFLKFHSKCIAAVPQDHFPVRTVRLDKGFFSEGVIESLEGDYLFFDVAAKKQSSLQRLIASIPEDDFAPFFPDESICGAKTFFRLDAWKHERPFVIVRKRIGYDDHGQGYIFPRFHYQVVCSNQEEMTAKEIWEDYNQRARIELTIRELSYDHFITKVPTGKFLSNYAYFWHCVLSYNLMLLFKKYVLSGEWEKSRTSTVRKKLLDAPGRLVNRCGRMLMRVMVGFPYVDLLQNVKEQLVWLYRSLHPIPA
jgi:hypothetical protein